MSPARIWSHLPLHSSYHAIVLHDLDRCPQRDWLPKNQEQQHHLEACEKCRVSGHTPDLLSHFNKIPQMTHTPIHSGLRSTDPACRYTKLVVPEFAWWFWDTPRQRTHHCRFLRAQYRRAWAQCSLENKVKLGNWKSHSLSPEARCSHPASLMVRALHVDFSERKRVLTKYVAWWKT